MEGGDFLRKAWTTTLIFLALCCLAACANGKAAAIKQMAAAEKGTYSICVFWDGEQTD
ncbi:hypothetical protein [Cohnella zeiphila]|uniref:Uncharacterized protein n=1 Tax=Cohnella zeiphila TaxID=2761120 RepID=A0A7X0SPH8_9BACL|nr:hypothetical protein [Cohnella zeiphila]MBB6733783.1 hypothetical protein [Cohnella zeiphila]